MKIEIGGRYISLYVKNLVVIVTEINHDFIYAAHVYDDNFYKNAVSINGGLRGKWTRDSFNLNFRPVIRPGNIWKELNQ